MTLTKFKRVQKKMGLTNWEMAEVLKVNLPVVERIRMGKHKISALMEARIYCVLNHERGE